MTDAEHICGPCRQGHYILGHSLTNFPCTEPDTCEGWVCRTGAGASILRDIEVAKHL